MRRSFTRLVAGIATVVLVLGISAAPAFASIDVSVGGQERSFSPNGDGQDDVVSTSYCLSEGANLDIVVKDASLNVVRTIESGVSHGGGCDYVSWDGTNTAGAIVADGAYTLAFHASGASGSGDAVWHTAVDTRIPGALTSPHPGNTLSGTASFVFTPTSGFSPTNTITNVYVDCIGSADTPAGNGTFTASGDTSLCGEGSITIAAHVSFTDAFGANHGWESPGFSVTIQNPVRAESTTSVGRVFSPNDDGQEDSIGAGFCLSRDATVDVVVKNASNTVVRKLESGISVSGHYFPTGYCYWSGGSVSVTWDGKNDANAVVPDGNYSIELDATDTQLNTASATQPIVVDTRVPGTLTQPASGALLSGDAPFVFTPTPGFDTLSGVYVDCLGSGTLQGNGTWTGSADVSTCAPNVTSLTTSVWWYDQFGASHGWTAPAKPVTVALRVTRPAGEPTRSFSPDGDGQDDTVTAGYCLTNDAAVTITVRNAANDVVRTLATNDPQAASACGYYYGTNSITWDGKATNGSAVADGDYTIQIHAVTGSETDDLSILTTVDTRVPGTLTTPASGATLTETGSFVFTPTANFPTASAVGIDSVSVDCINAVSYSPEADGTYAGSGTTDGCTAGPAELHTHVSWIDQYGNRHFWTSPTGVSVNFDKAPIIVIDPTEVYPTGLGFGASHSFSPNGDGQEDENTAGYCLKGADATVDVVVKDASNVVVRTLLQGEPQSGNGNSCNFYSVTWDGKDDLGHLVPDGAYSFELHAVAVSNGATADASIPTTVDNRTPGTLTEPSFAQTLQGLVNFSFTPTPGFQDAGANTIDSITGCFSNDNTCVSMLNASPDGVWRTTKPASQLTTGAADFSWSVNYHDTYGTQHTWTSPVPVALSINSNPNPILAVGATPQSGPAPLATTVHFDVSDSGSRPIAYSVDFGDGSSPVTGTKTSPYAGGVSLAHNYSTPGSRLATVSISNGAGGSAQKSVTVVASGTEAAPDATLSVSPTKGTAPTQVTATFSATDADSATLTYSVNFGDGSAASTGTLPDGPVQHTYTQPGSYAVRLAVSDGTYTDVRSKSVSIGLSEPLVAKAGDDQTAIVNQAVHFDGSASRPLVGITSYSWAFGDGGTASTATADHTYTTTGTKTATLTVHAGATVATDTMKVVVNPVPVTPGLHVTVTGSSGAVQGADVLVLDSDGVRHPATTDDTGEAHLTGLVDGKYAVYAWHDGYLPTTGNAVLANGIGTLSIALTEGSVGQTDMTSTPITDPAQLQALGIDPNDAANQNVFEFEIHLAFVEGGTTTDLSFGGFATGEGILQSDWGGGGSGGGGGGVIGGGGDCTSDVICASVGGGGGGGYTVYPGVGYVGSTPTIVWMVIPGRAKWLKEFFDVRMVVTNLGSSQFSFQHGTASLAGLPAGLSLAPTGTPQTVDHVLPDIPGGQSAETHWVVRGDTEGLYTLAAQYSGSLEPLGAPIHLAASTSPNALHVWGGSALHLVVDTDASAAVGSPYRIRVGMNNVADVPMFNPSLEFLEPGRKNYIYQPEEDLFDATDRIQPGATFFTHYLRLLPEISGNLVTSLSFVKKTAGNVDNVTSSIQPHTAVAGLPVTGTRSGTTVTLNWNAPTVGAGQTINGYRIYFTPTRDTAFGPTPVTTTTAAVHTATITKPILGSYAVSTVVDGVPTMFHKLFGFVPSAPVAPAATPGNTTATVTWSPPVSNGGSPITGYTVTPVVGTTPQTPRVFTSPATTEKVTGLTNGTTYTFRVAALNAAGTGATATTTAIVVGVPIAPTILGVTPGTAQVILKWAAPGNVAPTSITKYVVTPYLGTSGQPAQSFASTATTQTVRFLTNNNTYTFRIVAWNSVGPGDPSDDSPLVKVGAPVAPTGVKATPGNNAATVTWNAVATTDNGGAAISGYVLNAYLGTSTTPAVTSTVTGTSKVLSLPSGNGKKYSFAVSAKNGNQRTGLSNSSTQIIVGAPTAPAVSAPTPGSNAATVNWSAVPAGQSGGASITGYVITPYLGTTAQPPVTSTGTGTTKAVTLASGNGRTYKFKVAAKNANNLTGVQSDFTPTIIVGAPTAPTGLSVSLAPTSTTDGGTTATATATWNPLPAANDGGLPLVDYAVTTTRDSGTIPGDAQTWPVTGNSLAINGLVAGERYTFAVVARNSIYTGLQSPATPGLVVGAPAAPAITTATAGVGQVTLAWTVPANNGSTITDYLVTPRVAGIALPTLAPVTTTSTTITGLVKGAAYTFTVAARNARGIGRDSVATIVLKPT